MAALALLGHAAVVQAQTGTASPADLQKEDKRLSLEIVDLRRLIEDLEQQRKVFFRQPRSSTSASSPLDPGAATSAPVILDRDQFMEAIQYLVEFEDWTSAAAEELIGKTLEESLREVEPQRRKLAELGEQRQRIRDRLAQLEGSTQPSGTPASPSPTPGGPPGRADGTFTVTCGVDSRTGSRSGSITLVVPGDGTVAGEVRASTTLPLTGTLDADGRLEASIRPGGTDRGTYVLKGMLYRAADGRLTGGGSIERFGSSREESRQVNCSGTWKVP